MAAYPGVMRRVGALLMAGTVVAALGACGRSVAVEPLPITGDGAREACAALIGELPRRISTGRAWDVEPDPASTSAWGSPPVVLRCGDVPGPQPTEQLLAIGDMTWLVTPLTDGEQYTTVDRAPGVIVTVPQVYQPTSAVVAELSAVVAKHTQPEG